MKSLSELMVALRYSLSRFLMATVFFISICPASAQTNTTDEWILTQNHVDLGQTDLYVCHEAIKIVNRHFGFQLLAKAPQWTVHCFRPEEKVEWVGQLNQFNGAMLINPAASGAKNGQRFVACGSGMTNGLKYTRYAPWSRSLAAVYGADDMAVAPQAAEFVCRFYDLPDTGKIPLFRSRVRGRSKCLQKSRSLWFNLNVGNDLRTGLATELLTKCGRKLPFNASDFACPQGYERTSLPRIALSSSQKEALSDAIVILGFASDRACSHIQLSSQKGVPGKGGSFSQ